MTTPIQCVIHCRVSTGKQAYEGESLDVQKGICLELAARNGWTVAHEPWIEAYSGRKNARPAFTEVLAFLDAHPGRVRYYVFRAIDRFTRGGTGMYENMKAQLARRGVELVDSMGVIQPMRNTLEHVGFEYDWSRVSPSEVAEAVLATTAKAEATTILTRLIGQEIRLTQQGYKIRGAVDGYQNERIQVEGKRRVIQVPHPERSQFYIAMFELRAAGGLTDTEIVERINAMGFRTRIRHRWDAPHQRIIGQRGGNRLTVKRLQEIIKRPIYCGVIWEKWTNWKPVRASYDGLISTDTWNEANRGALFVRQSGDRLELLNNLYGARSVRTKHNPEFPFRRVILCPTCQTPFLGSASRSRTGRHIPAYHCARGHSRVARNKPAFENAVYSFIERLRFERDVVVAAADALHARFAGRAAELKASALEIIQAGEGLASQKEAAIRAFLNATTDTMRRALEIELERLDQETARCEVQRDQLTLSKAEFEDYLQDLTRIMEHPSILLENAANPLVQRARWDLAFGRLPNLYEIENGTAELSPIMTLCRGEIDPQSVQVRLSVLNWNQIEAGVHKWKEALKPPPPSPHSRRRPIHQSARYKRERSIRSGRKGGFSSLSGSC